MAVSRLVLVAIFVGLLVLFTPWPMAALGGLEFALYLALYVASAAAARDPDPLRGSRRLSWRSDLLMLLLVVNACGLAVLIRLYDNPHMRVEAALLATCVLLFAALRFHISALSYPIGVVPPTLTLIWIAIDWAHPLAPTHYTLAMLLFVGAVLMVTWRQQATDRSLTQAMRDLARKNAALSQAVEEAKAANRAKTDLLAIASHEIRTPLNAVQGFAQALRREPLTPDQARLVQGVLEGGGQLTRLLDGILNLTRLEAADHRLDPTPVDLRRMIETVARLWTEHATAMGVTLAFEDADPELSFLVRTDEVRVEQTLVSLVSNAIGCSPAGGRVEVRLAGVARDDAVSVLIEVADAGPAPPLEDRSRMFEAFDQTDRGRHLGASGLGMRMCAQNLALMGGEIGFDDRPEAQGVVFWFAFDAPRSAAAPERSTDGADIAGVMRVLAAEDNAANRAVLAALLSSAPVDLVFAEDGAQAVEAWRSRPFDLVLMDVNMPVMNGREAVREMRRAEALGAHTPIWMLTANVFDDDIANYLADGADGVLRKPVDVASLFELLATLADPLPET